MAPVGDGALPAEVIALLEENIASVAALEVLMFLLHHAARQWSAAEVAAQLGVGVHDAREALEGLCAQGFLAVRTAHDVLFWFDPGSLARRRDAEALARIYSERRVAVLRHLTTRSIERIRAFSDAFRLRRS